MAIGSGQPSPLSAAITMAGRSYSYADAVMANIEYTNDFTPDDGRKGERAMFDEVLYDLIGDDTFVWGGIASHTGDLAFSTAFDGGINYQLTPADVGYGGFRAVSWVGGSAVYSDAVLQPLSLMVRPAPPAAFTPTALARGASAPAALTGPGPATWIRLLAGFAAGGSIARRSRRRRTVPAAAAIVIHA